MPEYRFDEIAINSKEKKKPTEEDKYTYIGLEHLDTGSLTVSRWGSEIAPTGDKLVMHKGDVLFGKRRAYQKKVAIAPFDGIFSAHGMVLRPREEVVTKDFFPLFISSDFFLDEAIKISVGSLSPTINWSDLKELTFTLPTLEEQRKLAPVIWAAIDTKNAYKRLLLGIDELVKSQFVEMFDQKYPSITAEKACEIIVDCPHATPKYDGVELNCPAIRTSEIANGTIVWDSMKYVSKAECEKRNKRLTPEAGDIVYAREGSYGDCVILPSGYDFCLGQRTMLFRPNRKICTSEFLHQALRSDVVKRQADEKNIGVTVPHVNVADAKQFSFPLPPLEAQMAFGEFMKQSDKSKFAVRSLLLFLRSQFSFDSVFPRM